MQLQTISLLRSRRFWPLFLAQFFGALNDNFYRNALVVLVSYKIISAWGSSTEVMVTLVGALFVLPAFLFSAFAGQLADKYEKSQLLRLIKFIEVLIGVMVLIGFVQNNTGILVGALTLLASQYAFFGPVKYSILPSLLNKDELIEGNGLVEASTFIAILLGTIFGGAVAIFETEHTVVIGIVIALIALLGWVMSWFVPRVGALAPQLKLNPNIFAETLSVIRYSATNRTLLLAILGISWFFLIGSSLLLQLPNLVPNVLHAKASVVTLFLATFTTGIAVGSILCNRLLKGKLNNTYVPLGILGISIFLFDFVVAIHGFAKLSSVASQPVGLTFLFSHFSGWRMLIDLYLMAVFGGLYIVPLYVTLQIYSEKTHVSRVIASNNIINALFMVVAAILVGFLLLIDVSLLKIFVLLALLNTVIAIYVCGLIPDAVVKTFVKWVLKFLYKVEVHGLPNYKKAGKRVLIIANHTSFLDALLLAAFLPGKPTFAINRFIAEQLWVKMLLNLVKTFPIDPSNAMSAKSLIEELEKDRKVMIFPEGRITVTGALMKVYEGPGLIADKANANILPVHISGAQYTRFSRLRGRVNIKCFPKITIRVLAPQKFSIDPKIKGRERRKILGSKLYDLMTDMMFQSADYNKTVFEKVIESKRINGRKKIVLEDTTRKHVTYQRFITATFVLGSQLAKRTVPAEHVGLMLPNVTATAVAFYGLHVYGRIPAMINFTAGISNIISAVKTGALRLVITSHRFIEAGKLEPIVQALSSHVKLLYLEDVGKKIRFWHKLIGLFKAQFPLYFYHRQTPNVTPDNCAVILFTSGSEGTPKGVALSHKNLQANAAQTGAVVDFNSRDVVFNCLPLFHTFGLTGGLILPLTYGLKCFQYPSPLHYRIIPELIYDTNATILFGTDTFLGGYAQYAHPYDFYSLRYIFAGAEKLKDETRKIWGEKFGARVFEGYGVTETAPIIASNTPMHNRPGTVGRILPGMEFCVKPVPGIKEGGELHVKGPNVMMGYYKADRPGILQPHTGEWYNTGDIVTASADGYITIIGRTKRFAKIAGEMISLAAVETFVANTWPEQQHAVVAIADAKKGEQLVLLTTAQLTQDDLIAAAKDSGISKLATPKEIVIVKEVPLLGSGKTNYPEALEVIKKKLFIEQP